MSKILIVCEGRKTEPNILSNLFSVFKNRNADFIISYNTNIYKLYDQIKDDPFLDVFELLKQSNTVAKDALINIRREMIAEIYIVFDHDAHDKKHSPAKLSELFKKFDNETENGKLYVSYPMIEAIRHCPNDNNDKIVKICKDDFKIYKKHTVGYGLDNPYYYTNECWKKIITTNLVRANFLLTGLCSIPDLDFIKIVEGNDINRIQEDLIENENSAYAYSPFAELIRDIHGSQAIAQVL